MATGRVRTGHALNRVLPANAGVAAMHLQLPQQHGLPATALTAALLGYGASHLLANLAGQRSAQWSCTAWSRTGCPCRWA